MTPSSTDAHRPLGGASGTALVIASMIGAGIFTTTGTLATTLPSTGALLAVWTMGGALALAAAMSFGELGAMMPGPGAEVHYLRRVFGPTVGFLAGWVTLLAGFAVPIAAVASTLGQHMHELFGIDARLGATLAIALVAAIHGHGVRFGARFNDVTCAVKLLVILTFIGAGLIAPDRSAVTAGAAQPIDAGAFAHGLVLVAFAYTGWNAAAYVGGEIRDPGRLLPRALIAGTGLVTLLYLLCNAVFLRAATPQEMAGVQAIGQYAAERLFGTHIAAVFSSLIAVLLLSTLSSFAMAGPRVAVSMAEDGELPALFATRNARGAPLAAAALLALCSIGFLWSASFEWLLEYVGFLLTLSAGLAVAGLLVLRRRAPDAPRPYRVPLYPVLPIAFVLLSAWMIVQAASAGWSALIGGGVTLVLGAALRPLLRQRSHA